MANIGGGCSAYLGDHTNKAFSTEYYSVSNYDDDDDDDDDGDEDEEEESKHQ